MIDIRLAGGDFLLLGSDGGVDLAEGRLGRPRQDSRQHPADAGHQIGHQAHFFEALAGFFLLLGRGAGQAGGRCVIGGRKRPLLRQFFLDVAVMLASGQRQALAVLLPKRFDRFFQAAQLGANLVLRRQIAAAGEVQRENDLLLFTQKEPGAPYAPGPQRQSQCGGQDTQGDDPHSFPVNGRQAENELYPARHHDCLPISSKKSPLLPCTTRTPERSGRFWPCAGSGMAGRNPSSWPSVEG